jgi:hypothetical protein
MVTLHLPKSMVVTGDAVGSYRMWLRAFVAITLAVALASCGERLRPLVHRVYAYQAILSESPWHPGTTITVEWTVQDQGLVPSAHAVRLSLDVSMTGRFASVDDLKSAPSSKPVVVSTPTIGTDDWSGVAFTTQLTLPRDLEPGLYNVVQRVSQTGGAESAGTVVTVTA